MAKKNRVLGGFLQATNYLNSHLNSDEVPLYRAHLSWIPIFVHQIPFLLFGGIIGGIVWAITNNFLIGLAVYIAFSIIGIFSQIGLIYRNISTDILITNHGLHSKKKLIAVADDRFTRHQYINDVELDFHGIFQRMFEYGTCTVPTIGDTDSTYIFKNLAKPETFKQAMRAIRTKYGNGSSLPFEGQVNQQQTQLEMDKQTNEENSSRRRRKKDK